MASCGSDDLPSSTRGGEVTHKMIEVTTHDVTPTGGGLLHHSTCWCKQPDPDAVTYECECCLPDEIVEFERAKQDTNRKEK